MTTCIESFPAAARHCWRWPEHRLGLVGQASWVPTWLTPLWLIGVRIGNVAQWLVLVVYGGLGGACRSSRVIGNDCQILPAAV